MQRKWIRGWIRFSLTLVLVMFFMTVHYAFGMSGEEIFAKVSPSVVLIKNLAGFGSGVVIDKKGTILSNSHVVDSPFELEVTAQVVAGGRIETRVFRKVKVTAVHSQFDLAILQIDPGNAFLKPIEFAKEAPKAGESCFAIGNPAGVTGLSLVNTISEGVVSSTNQIIEGYPYIETSAPVNPGNSGGALCNANGQLVGIVTLKSLEADKLGFAIPSAGIVMRDFKSPQERKPNPELSARLAQRGAECYLMAQREAGLDKERLNALAVLCYSLALTEDPQKAARYYILGKIYADAERYDIAKPYFLKTIELNPEYSWAFKYLGNIEKSTNNMVNAGLCWKRGLASKQEEMKAGAGVCAENIACEYFEHKRYPEAAYYMSWAMTMGKAENSSKDANRMRVIADSMEKLNEKQKAYFSVKKGGYSFVDLDNFINGNFTVDLPAPAPVKPLQESAYVFKSVDPQHDWVLPDELANLRRTSVDPGTNGIKEANQGTITHTCLAYGGAYLCAKFNEIPQIGVFNIAQAKWHKMIPEADTNCLIAAGGKVLCIYCPTEKKLKTWDLSTLSPAQEFPCNIPGTLTGFEMGLLNPHKALASSKGAGFVLVDTTSGKVVPSKMTGRSNHMNLIMDGNALERFRVNNTLDTFFMWSPMSSPSIVEWGSFDKAHQITISTSKLLHQARTLGLSSDETKLFGCRGYVDRQNRHKPYNGDEQLYAIVGDNGCLGIDRTPYPPVLHVMTPKLRKTATSFSLPAGVELSMLAVPGRLAEDRAIIGSAYIGRVVVIDNAKKMTHVYNLGVLADLTTMIPQAPKANPGEIEAGERWTKQLNVAEGATVKVEVGPKDIIYDPATRTLSYTTPPQTRSRATIEILLSITEAGKTSYYVKEQIVIK